MPKDFDQSAIADYLKGCVRLWREKRDKVNTLPIAFTTAWEQLSKEQQNAFMANFYVDAFQAVHDTIYGCLVLVEKAKA